MDRGSKTIAVGAGFSLLLLAAVFILQYFKSPILEIETRWLLVAGTPLLAALIAGGYIKVFKGFGLEIETRLQSDIADTDLTAVDAETARDSVMKGEVDTIDGISPDDIPGKERLIFIKSDSERYAPAAFGKYLKVLYNLKYIEVWDRQGKLEYTVSAEAFRNRDGLIGKAVDSFVKNLNGLGISPEIEPFVEKDFITGSDNLISILPKVRRSKFGWLPVLDPFAKTIGIITKNSIESRIVDEILSAQEKS